jgi:hypothetical protein
MVYTGIGDCRAVKPGYDIPYSQYGASFKGLPGMSGGAKTRKGMRKNKSRKQRNQRGGRYGFAPEMDPNASGQAWWAGSYAPIQRIGCEGGSFNPLNPTHTGSSAPPGAANPNYWMAKGGAQMAPATYGVGNVDSMYYYAPTGGYANNASTWKDSVGAPVQIQVPYAARAMNQACLTTGGPPPLTGALQQGGQQKRTRKQQRGGAWANYLKKVPFLGKYVTGPEASAPGVNAVALANVTRVMTPATEGNAYVEVDKAGLLGNTPRTLANAAAQPLPASPRESMNNGNNGNNTPLMAMGGRRRKHKKSKSRKHKGRKH